jgi:uncharacterized membrane protein
MDDVILARAVHVLAVVIWIGGVALVTTVLLPAVRRFKSAAERIAFFESVEMHFAVQARITTALAGLSGLYIIYRLNLWDRFAAIEFWWMHAMVGVWLVFSLMLFIAEPLFVHRFLVDRASAAAKSTFRLIGWMHWILLALSIFTLLGAVAGSHGFLLFSSAGWRRF